MYNHETLERKWQKFWKDNNVFAASNISSKEKYYVLDMFPYPSGAGLHVGHPEGYTANDIIARYKHAKGYNVLHPMGWDAFGLPAENYAIKTGVHPRITTAENIATFKKQIQSLGFSYDWNREIDTTDPKYFQWTQWIFLKLFEAGLAYEQDLPINYCPSCKTGLANEEVLADFSCERCGTQVEKKKIRQWVLAITKYAERLLKDVDDLDWPEGIKDMQRNWIGRSEGCEFEMKKQGDDLKSIRVYTTRIDTVFGMTYAVIAPDHPDVEHFIEDAQRADCEAYIDKANKQSDQDRTADDKEKTGVFTGSFVVNPYNGESVPLWIADYVLGSYGTGAVMAVPAHDERDFAFAKKYNLGVNAVIGLKKGEYKKVKSDEELEMTKVGEEYLFFTNKEVITQYGILIKSGEYDGMSSQEAKEKLTELAEEKGFGSKKVNYKLRDWLFSRQRYWGEPIPLIHLAKEDVKKLPHIRDISEATDSSLAYILKRPATQGERTDGVICCSGDIRELVINGKVVSKIYDGIYGKIICDYNLPLELPQVDEYAPAGDGQSPLAKVEDFVHVQLAENLSGKRETNTMPQWGGSCWYYLRFMDAENPDALVGNAAESYWGQVDSYVGGAEHAVLHLLYARFWHKFLFDIGVVSSNEPFYRLRNQGMILGMSYRNAQGKLIASDLVEEKDGQYIDKETGDILEKIPAKMSKSLKNVINPDDIVKEYGADTLRLYEMYMGDFADSKPWDTSAIVGVRRFLDKVWRAFAIIDGGMQINDFDTDSEYKDDEKSFKVLHKSIKKIGEDIENYKFNTAIAQMMILIKNIPNLKGKNSRWLEFRKTFLKLLHPFAPHMAEELWNQGIEYEKEFGYYQQSYAKIYYATGNQGKIDRVQEILSDLPDAPVFEKVPELIDVEENAPTPLACALQKLEAYKNKGYTVPVMAADTAVYFENQDFDPTKVRRSAIEAAGKNESELSPQEIAQLMIEFYKDIATKNGGEVEIYYKDSFAVLYPNGEVKTIEYSRPYVLTDIEEGDINIHAPLRSLTYSKTTGKRAYQTSTDDYKREFQDQIASMRELFEIYPDSVYFTAWPSYDEAMTIDNEVTIGVQVLGKLRGEIKIAKDEDKDSVLSKAKANPDVMKWIDGKDIVKEIYVPGKIVNIVVK